MIIVKEKVNPLKTIDVQRPDELNNWLYADEFIIPMWRKLIKHRGNTKPYYWVSNYGRIVSNYTGQFIPMSLQMNKKSGRMYFSVQFEDGTELLTLLNRAVLMSFCPRADMYNLEADHINDIVGDNRIVNLQWLTREENIEKAKETGRIICFEDVIIVRMMYDIIDGMSDIEAAVKYNMSPFTVRNIRLGYGRYGDIISRYGLNPIDYGIGKLSEKDYVNISKLAHDGKSDEEIQRILNLPVEVSTIGAVRRGSGSYSDIHRRLGLEAVFHVFEVTDEMIVKVITLAELGYEDKDIQKLSGIMNIPLTTVTNIRLGKGGYFARLQRLGLSPVYFDNLCRLTIEDFRKLYYILEDGASDEYAASCFKSLAVNSVINFRLGRGAYRDILNILEKPPIFRSRDIPDEIIIEIMQFIAANYPNNVDILAGDKFGYAPNTIRNLRYNKERLGKLGLEPINYIENLNLVTDDEINRIMKLVQQGYTDNEISEIVNRPARTIRDIRTGAKQYEERLRKLGWEPVNRATIITDDMYRAVIYGLMEGKTAGQLRHELGISKPTIHDIGNGIGIHGENLKRLNLPTVITKFHVTDEQYRRIFELRMAGFSMKLISKDSEVKLSEPTVRKILHGEGDHLQREKELGLIP